MMMSMNQTANTAERRPSAQMRAVWCGLGLSLSPTNFAGGTLGKAMSIVDAVYIRH
jgi:hypothetical protein